jgi:hypothetical protein
MKPTVLIGLGGIGSKTVDTIYGLMTDEQKSLTASAVLDTDVGDLQKLKNINIAIQTSPSVKVGNYVHRHPETKAWFPTGYKKIDEMMLTDGAGQIRALSRLSFYSAIESGALSQLDRAVEKLSLINDNNYSSDVNVVIVGTIAGGTASGSFLQMGMYMRHYFAQKNPNASIFIQGVFLLPDTILKTGKIVQSEWSNLRFNAYASLKELNAILSPSVMNKINIELEYHPSANSKITYENRPFDNILFFDYENSSNQHLNSFGEYLDLLSETIYYAYISPISSDYQSRFVNQIREFIRNNQESFYSASSVNKLIYPHEDLVDYLSLEWIIKEIDTSWLQFDKQYEEEVREYKQNLAKGITVPKVELSKVYIDNMDRLEKAEKTPFFSMVFKQSRIWNEEKGQVVATKDDAFVDALLGHIDKALDNDSDFIVYREDCNIQSNMLEDMDNAKKHVRDLEDNHEFFKGKIDEMIQKHKNMLVKEIMTQDCKNERLTTDNSYNINHWLLSEDEALHPVTTRYFLYKVNAKLEKEIDILNEEIKTTKDFVDNYYKVYNIDSDKDTENEEYYETAVEVIDLISQQGFIGGVINRIKGNSDLNFEDFVDGFTTKYSSEIRRLEKLLRLRLKKGVLEKVLNYLAEMIRNWEGLFSMLSKDLLEEIQVERNRLLHKHETTGKDIFVFGDKEMKQTLWNDFEYDLQSAGEDGDLAMEIGTEQYRLFCEQIDVSSVKKTSLSKSHYKKMLKKAYRQALLSKIGSKLDLNLPDAVYMERRLSAEETPELETYIEKLQNKNYPWIHTYAEDIILTRFWGAHDKSIYGHFNLEGNLTENEEFPANELIYLVMYHNLKITNFEKFSFKETHSGIRQGGDYFKAYQGLMEKIAAEPANYVTPHIDKRWGIPTYMPDLNNDVTLEAKNNIARAFIVGLLEKNIYMDKQDGNTYFIARSAYRSRKIEQQGKVLKSGKYLKLYRALAYNPLIVGDMLKFHNDAVEKNLNVPSWDVETDIWLQSVKESNLLDLMLTILRQESRDEEEYEEVLNFVAVFGSILSEYIYQGFGERFRDRAENYILGYKEDILSTSALSDLSNSDQDNIRRAFLK